MAHHRRKGPKSTRAGCLLCKPHKRQGAGGSESKTRQDRRVEATERESLQLPDHLDDLEDDYWSEQWDDFWDEDDDAWVYGDPGPLTVSLLDAARVA